MARSVALARKLLLVPILVIALYVVIVEATAAPPTERGPWISQPDGVLEHKPFGRGDGRRMR